MKGLRERFEKYQVYWYGLYKKLSKEEEEYITKLYPELSLEVATYLYFYINVKGEKNLQTKCKVCNNLLSFTNIKNRNKCCSNKCSGLDPEKLNKTKNTWLTKYGVDNPSKNDEIKAKKEKTTLKNYGVKYTLQSKELRDKVNQTQIKKYGYIHNFSAEPVMREHRRKMKNKYGVEYNSQMHLKNPNIFYDTIENLSINNTLEISLEDYYNLLSLSGLTDSAGKQILRKYNITLKDQGVSLPEQDLIAFIKSLNVNYDLHVKGLLENSRYELDVVFPDKNLAIEFDGIYFHSAKSKEEDEYMSKRHITKTDQCNKVGIQLLHIFENEWLDPKKQKVWKSVIRNKLNLTTNKIYARKCKLVEISNKIAKDFCDDNHLQGGIYGSINLGLYYNNELVQVAILSKPRFNKKYQYELLRLCSKINTIIVGGSSKLLKGYNNLISYANRRWSNGGVYEELKFKLVKITSPCYWYWHSIRFDNKLQHRSAYQKHKLPKLLGIFNPGLTEQENMYNNGFKRIWDCGNYVYERK